MRLQQQQDNILTCLFLCAVASFSLAISQEQNLIQKAMKIFFEELSTTSAINLDEKISFPPLFYKQSRHQSGFDSNSILPGIKVNFKNLSDIQSYISWRPQYRSSFLPFIQMNVSLNEFDDDVFQLLLNEAFAVPRNHETNPNAKISAALLIGWIMGQSGNIIGSQSFSPKNFKYLFHDKNIGGLNVISILPGRYWGTHKDRVIVVGSHYDTVKDSSGYNDNGSGTAAMMKIHASVSKDKKCSRRFSVIFVAFDLEEYGFHGSQAFVEDFLKPTILNKFNQTDIQFAIILDSIMNFNQTKGSQELYPGASTLTPRYHDFVLQNEARGDFITLLGRQKEEAQLMTDIKESMRVKTGEILLNELQLDSFDSFAENFNYLRSDHIQFWLANLRAITVSDTGNLRGIMKECYHKSCDHPFTNSTVTPFANKDFLYNITDSLTDIIMKYAC